LEEKYRKIEEEEKARKKAKRGKGKKVEEENEGPDGMPVSKLLFMVIMLIGVIRTSMTPHLNHCKPECSPTRGKPGKEHTEQRLNEQNAAL
jgi:hypothetical protein